MVGTNKETSRRRITVTSTLDEISRGQLGNLVVVWGGGGGALLRLPPSSTFFSRLLDSEKLNGFSSPSDIPYMLGDMLGAEQFDDSGFPLFHKKGIHLANLTRTFCLCQIKNYPEASTI
jgi:hypothetical protein